MKELTVRAGAEYLEEVMEFIRQELTRVNCPLKAMMQTEVAVEEIFTNIAFYAYAPNTGDVTVCCEYSDSPAKVTIQFLDGGTPFNPLEKECPNLTLPLEERRQGGLGIVLVKKMMDTVDYCYRDGKNALTVSKNL